MIDLGTHLIRLQRWDLPQNARGVFEILQRHGVVDADLADVLKRMVGFRNIAVHDYQAVQIPIVIAIIEKHLDDLLTFARIALQYL